ncbi:hypothetical protein [Stackebrandtia soli]|uniref:hypothetical protein n=1 Tax=Stackebrandtia soli TaxID=1892856 RepID=UPI0039E80B76
MTTTPDQRGHARDSRLIRVTVTCLFIALAALALRWVATPLPPRLDYTVGFAPWWVMLTATVLGGTAVTIISVIRSPLGKHVSIIGGTAAVLFLWSASGVVLDGFRAFFAITGIPAGDFSTVDWPGMVCRTASLLACGAIGYTTLRARRSRAKICAVCKTATPPLVTGHRWHGIAAAALGIPYPALKLYWWCGGVVARPESSTEGFPTMELLAGAAGLLVSLALVHPWGRVLPRWALLSAAGVATTMLISMGSLSVLGTLSQLLGITDGPVPLTDDSMWMVAAVYGTWLLFGLALLGAIAYYVEKRRPRCAADASCPV